MQYTNYSPGIEGGGEGGSISSSLWFFAPGVGSVIVGTAGVISSIEGGASGVDTPGFEGNEAAIWFSAAVLFWLASVTLSGNSD